MATLKPQAVRSGTITQSPLKKRLLCCLMAKGLKVLTGQLSSSNKSEYVYMAVGAVVGVLCGTELDLSAKPLFQGKHGVNGDVGKIKVFVAVFTFRVGTEDKTVKDGALLRIIYHAVGLLFRECAIIAKERAGVLDKESVQLIYNALHEYKPTNEEEHLLSVLLEEFEEILVVDYNEPYTDVN